MNFAKAGMCIYFLLNLLNTFIYNYIIIIYIIVIINLLNLLNIEN